MHVKGAAEQFVDLLTAVTGVGPGTSLADKVIQAQTALGANHVADACSGPERVDQSADGAVRKEHPRRRGQFLIGDATRIRADSGC